MTIEEAVLARHSVRRYASTPLTKSKSKNCSRGFVG